MTAESEPQPKIDELTNAKLCSLAAIQALDDALKTESNVCCRTDKSRALAKITQLRERLEFVYNHVDVGNNVKPIQDTLRRLNLMSSNVRACFVIKKFRNVRETRRLRNEAIRLYTEMRNALSVYEQRWPKAV